MALASSTLSSRDGRWTRRAWFLPGPSTPHRLGVLLDGEFYLEKVGALPIIQRLSANQQIPAMSWLFIESGGGAARHVNYTGDADFSRFIADEVVEWARPKAALTSGGHLIGGLSLSGLAAAHIAVLHPERFSAALCQSGSFWHQPSALAARIAARRPTPTRFWLSVGDQETEADVSHPPTGLYQGISQIAGVKLAQEALGSSASAVHLNTYAGGHTFDPWRLELADALRWLLAPAP